MNKDILKPCCLCGSPAETGRLDKNYTYCTNEKCPCSYGFGISTNLWNDIMSQSEELDRLRKALDVVIKYLSDTKSEYSFGTRITPITIEEIVEPIKQIKTEITNIIKGN